MDSAITFDGALQITPPNQFQSTVLRSTCDFSLSDNQVPYCLSSLLQNPHTSSFSNNLSNINIVDDALKTKSNQFQSRILRSPCDFSLSDDRGPYCLGTLLQNPNTSYFSNNLSNINIVDDALKTKSNGSIFIGDSSFDIYNGTMQLSSEMVPSPEQLSSITYCSDGDAYSDSGFVDDEPLFNDSRMTPTHNYIQQTHFVEGNLNSINHGSFSDFPPSFEGKNSEVLRQIPEPMDISLSAYTDLPETPCEGNLRPQLKRAGSGQNDFLNRIEDSESTYSSLGQEHSFSSEAYSILFGLTDASKFVHMNKETLQQDLLSYTNYKRLHIDGSEVSFVQYMHSTVCNERTCNCDRFLLVTHFESCRIRECNICEPVRRLFVSGKSSTKTKSLENNKILISCENSSPPRKRLKTNSPVPFNLGVFHEILPSLSQNCEPEQKQWLQQWLKAPLFENRGASNSGTGVLSTFHISSGKKSTEGPEVINPPINFEELSAYSKNGDLLSKSYSGDENKVTEGIQFSGELVVDQQKHEGEIRIKTDRAKADIKSNLASTEDDLRVKEPKPKIMGVSLIDFFSVEEVKEHLSSLSPSVSQEMEGKLVSSVGENTCQLCFMEKLSFASTPVYCSCCGACIKHRLLYYSSTDEMGTRHSFCTRCFKASRGGDISFLGICISKQKLQKEINHHVEDESWVQCDKCKGWQHQICALYNGKRDLGGKAEYVCPKCFLLGISFEEYAPLPKTGAFVAKDLPTTMLSDHIEQRLFRRLKEERKERAKASHMKYKEVPGASDLVVRVVLSVSKLLNVKQQFLDIIPDEKYPTEFPFKSKVILLFQKIEGVDVCLFGFYVQEFGSECAPPNQRCVYISYLDSVKYFRPEIKTTSGEALRTMVYHEILIGYLDYCKKHGFATCYIWACPPTKGEDYILYCHPDVQKNPKSDKLRHWYKSMLRKAGEEDIAVDCTNLHDHFFVPTGERNSKITVARLPYFDGDYWSVAAMDVMNRIEHGSGVGSRQETKKVLTKRTLKSMGHSNIPGDVLKDILVMQRLGQTISPLKEDFIMVRLQYTCASCHEVILSGSHWHCYQCKNVHLCSRCHEKEGDTHFSGSGERHALFQTTVNDVPVDTDDRDVTLDNGYLEYRHSFLSFCQGNHLQFDELRRAKYSSMMILYHLHNSTVKSVAAICRVCDQKIPVKQGWHCETCPQINVCDGCYKKQGSDCHVHELIRHGSSVNRGSSNGHTQPHELLRLRGVMEGLLMHATQCVETKSSTCPYPNCSQIRKLWRHAHQCSIRVGGGCQPCQRTWTLLRLHSENCRDSGCRVPRCMDLKKHAEMLALQSDARRSAAVLGSVRGV